MKETSRRSPGSRTRPRPAGPRADSRPDPRAESRIAAVDDAHARKAEAALSTIVYITLPPQAAAALGGFPVPEGTPIPVQTDASGLDLANLTPEAIVTGMLRVLAWNPSHPQASLYRSFAKAVRPGLLEELSDAAVQKAQARQWDVAEEIFLALAGLHPDRPEPILDLAFLHEERAALLSQESRDAEAEEEDERAHALYRDLLAAEPPFAPAFYHAALFFMKKRNFDRAVSLLTTYVGMGDDERKTARARELLGKLADSGYLDTLFREAYDFIVMGEEEKGLEKARAFIERYPLVWNGRFLEGWALRRLGRWDEGRSAFQKALDLGADEADTCNELSICQIELGDLSGARKSLERALRTEPENVKIIANLGALAFKQGRRGEAAGFFRAALDLDPEDQLAADWLARLESEAG